MNFDLPPPAPPAPVIERPSESGDGGDHHHRVKVERVTCSWGGCTRTASPEL